MAKSKMRLRFPNIILLLCGLILLIFLFDFLWRNVFDPTVPGDTEGIISASGTFASGDTGETLENDPSDATENPSQDATEEATEDPTSQTIYLSQSQINNGPLILVSATCPFLGNTNFTDFSANMNNNVKPRDTALKISPIIEKPISDLFDGYCADNGYVNLQIYSTSEIYTGAGSLYTNELVERSTGFTFDIGLITSTGDVVAYLTKRNEWMFANCWKYGFVVRYSDTKAGTTGIGFMPHHFRYVGLPHSLIMNEEDLCLEEYLTYLRDYTMDTAPLRYTNGDTAYEIYYVPAAETGDTEVVIPKDAIYSVSGNNTDGFILTIEKDAAAANNTTDPSTMGGVTGTDVTIPEDVSGTTTTTTTATIG